MADIRDQLRGLLGNSKLHKALADAFYAGLNSPAEFHEFALSDHMRRAHRMKIKNLLRNVMQTLVIDELPVPLPITADDLTSIAVVQLTGVPLLELNENEEVTRGYGRFVTFALQELARVQRRWFDLGYYSIRPEELNSYYELPVWTSSTGYTLYADSAGDANRTQVAGFLKGFCSNRAMRRLHSELDGLISSIANTVQLCVTKRDCDIEDGEQMPGLPIAFLAEDGGRVISACLTASCQRPATGEDELLERLHNAVVLLAQADKVAFDPVALSLSFAAIEALVCEEELPVTRQIKKHVSTLLVQSAEDRKLKERTLDKLYRIRCDVLHGRKVNALPGAFETVRTIAAAVIRAVACWRAHHLRVPGPPTWKELMDELNAASRKPGIVVGVPDLAELIPNKVPN